MNNKIFTAFVLTAFILSLAMVSAVYTVSPTTVVLTTSDLGNSADFNVADATTGEGDISLNGGVATTTISDSSSNSVLITLSDVSITDGTASTDVSASYTSIPTDFDTGVFSTSIVVSDGAQADETVQIVLINQFCSEGTENADNLELSIDVDNRGDSPDGEDDVWYVRDRIEVDVAFDNEKDSDDQGLGDLEDVTFELGLFERDTGKNVAEKLEWESKDDEQIELGNIDEGDEDEHTFEFVIPTEKIDEGDYVLMIKVFEENMEDQTCVDHDTSSNDYFYDIEIKRESDEERWVVFEDIDLNPSTTPCGTEVTLTAKMYNVGDEGDQDIVKVYLLNTDLGVDQSQIIEKFKDDDIETLEFTFSVPSDAEEGLHKLSLYAKYDYDEDDDEDEEYPNEAFDEESSPTKVNLNVEGSCIGPLDDVEVTAELSEDTPSAVIGKEVIVEVTLENTGLEEQTYDLDVSGTSDWADATITPSSVTLDAGESAIVEVALEIDEDAEAGDQEFTLTTSAGAESVDQDILVELEEGGLFSGALTGSAVGQHIRDNGFIYSVIIVDIILIVAIIIAVKSMVRKRPGA